MFYRYKLVRAVKWVDQVKILIIIIIEKINTVALSQLDIIGIKEIVLDKEVSISQTVLLGILLYCV